MKRIFSGRYYRPNNRGEVEADSSAATPMTYQRPWTHEHDETIALRRCRDPLANTGTLWVKTTRPLRVEPLELEVARPLPEVCARHGRPAESRVLVRSCFYDTDQHPRFPHRVPSRRPYDAASPLPRYVPPPVSTIVVGEWPTCARCRRKSGLHRWLSRLLLWIMAANLFAVVFIAVTDVCPVQPALVLGVFPGSLLGLVIYFRLRKKVVQPVTFRPIYDERFVFIRAHARFRRALAAMPDRPAEPQ